MNKIVAALPAALLALSLTACAETTGQASSGDGPAGSSPKASSTTTTKPTAPKKAAPAEPKIGDKYTYDDGLVVEIIAASKGKIDQYAAGGRPGGPLLKMSVRMTNKTPKKLEAALTQVTVAYGADGETADTVVQTGIQGSFSGTISKGRAKTAKYGFAVPKKGFSDLSVEVTPDFDHDSVTFTGAVK